MATASTGGVVVLTFRGGVRPARIKGENMDDPTLHARVRECLAAFDRLAKVKVEAPQSYPDQKRIKRLHDDLRDKCTSLALHAEYRGLNSSALDGIHSDWKLATDQSVNAARTVVEELRGLLGLDREAFSARVPEESRGQATGPDHVCPWCGSQVEPSQATCPGCGRQPDWSAWVESVHADAEQLAPPGWQGFATNEPLGSIANVAGYLRRELDALRIVGEDGRGPFWLEQANQLYSNVFRALDALRISDRPEQESKPNDCYEAERRLSNLCRWIVTNARKSDASTVPEPLKPDADTKQHHDDAHGKPKPQRGRRKADYETVQCEAQLAADWERARDTGVYKGDFAKQHGTTKAKLDAVLDRVAKRKARSDK